MCKVLSQNETTKIDIKMSVFEIYLNKINDLISNKKDLKLRDVDGSFFIENITEEPIDIKNLTTLNQKLDMAFQNKTQPKNK